MIVLDTDVLSLLEWANTPLAMALTSKMAEFPPKELGTTVINFEEQMRGWMGKLARTKNVKEQIGLYRKLNCQLRLYCTVKILNFDEGAAVEFQRLRKELRRLATMDLKVAAIVLANNAILVSRNLQDFSQIPGLKVEDWTK